MTKHLVTLIQRMIQGTPKVNTPMFTMMLPFTMWMNSALNTWKMKILPKANPYELFQKLNTQTNVLKPSDLHQFKQIVRTKFDD